MNVTALVPIKQVSERLPNKNFLDFCGRPLFLKILDTLLQVPRIEKIIVNTDSEEIMRACKSLDPRIRIIERPRQICGNDITMNTIIDHDLGVTSGEYFLQTHCTNPLLRADTITQAISEFFENIDQHDSLLSVEAVKKRVYKADGSPVNHSIDRLEQTQHLPEILVENSNLFLFSRSSFYAAGKSRVGRKPRFFPMSILEGIDIDYEEDLRLAELIYRNSHLLAK